MTVTDDEIVAAMRLLFERAKTVAEPSGACALAALLAGKVDVAGPARRRDDHRRQRHRRPLRGARGLTAAALALVLASAALHAGWNALVAGARDTHATTAVALVFGALVFAIPAALTWRIEAEAWPYIIASAALELVYFALLAAVYSRADYSFAYPIARGSAPVIVLLISVIALDVSIGVGAALGVLAVTAGVLLVRGVGSAAPDTLSLAARARGRGVHRGLHAGRRPRHPPRRRDPVLRGRARPVGDPVRARRRPHARLRRPPRGHRTCRAPAAGAGMVAAYLLVLAALERAEAAPVAALRETSVVMAAAGAAIASREKVPARRIAGAVLVVAGVAAIAF